MQDRLGIPVALDNDANLGAVGEHRHGAAEGACDVVYVKVASGLGAGLVLAGRLHRGATGIAGEVGHVPVRDDGLVCRCGSRGCLETEVSAPRLLHLLRPAYGDLDVPALLELDAAADPGVQRVLGDSGRAIGRALAGLCTVLNPEVVVVGGSLGASESLVRGVRTAVDRFAQPDAAAAVEVRSGRLGERAELVGAVALAISRAEHVPLRG
jgi:predicted NBD/HSP70 family sugar kinase